jgi:hypothetical protein
MLDASGVPGDASIPGDASAGLDAAPDGGMAGRCSVASTCSTAGAECVFGRCVKRQLETSVIGSKTLTSLHGAYDPTGAFRVAYGYYDGIGSNIDAIAFGPLSGTPTVVSGLFRAPPLHLSHRPTVAPEIAYYLTSSGKYLVAYGGGFFFDKGETIISYATRTNAAGDRFVAATVLLDSGGCKLRFASRIGAGAWSVPELLPAACSIDGRVDVHIGAAGDPQVVVSDGAGLGLRLLRQIAGAWTVNSLQAVALNSRPGFLLGQNHDGLSRLVFWVESGGTFDIHALTLENASITRDVSLGLSTGQVQVPFAGVAVGSDDALYALKRDPVKSAGYQAFAQRVDVGGVITTYPWGFVSGGSNPIDAIAVAANDEVALLHHGTSGLIELHRLVPTN